MTVTKVTRGRHSIHFEAYLFILSPRHIMNIERRWRNGGEALGRKVCVYYVLLKLLKLILVVKWNQRSYFLLFLPI